MGSTGCFQKAFGEPLSIAKIAQKQQLFYMDKEQYEYDKTIYLCPYPGTGKIEDSCEITEAGVGLHIQWEGDLNGDGFTDYIVANSNVRSGQEEIIQFFVLVVDGKNGLYEIGEIYTTKLSPTNKKKNGFLVLRSDAECLDYKLIKAWKKTSLVTFNRKTLKYQTNFLNGDEAKNLCSIKPHK
jgi:hypothetical protein